MGGARCGRSQRRLFSCQSLPHPLVMCHLKSFDYNQLCDKGAATVQHKDPVLSTGKV